MTQPTSIESYHKAVESGFISEKQRQVIVYFCDRAGKNVTQGEVSRHFGDTTRSYGTRFKELEDSGVIVCTGTVLDKRTNRNVKCYQLTGVVPDKPVKRNESKGAAAVRILKALLDEFSIEDYIYSVRDNEGEGWYGPRVDRFSQLIKEAKDLTK